MSQKEAPRVGLLKALVAGRVVGREVAAALRLSERQVRRLRRRFEAAGAEGLLHRSRGRASPRRLGRLSRVTQCSPLRVIENSPPRVRWWPRPA